MNSRTNYQVAARVLLERGHLDLAREMSDLADKAKARDDYFIDLGFFVGSLDRRDGGFYTGALLLDRLIEDGWTPPEGLF